MAKIVFTSGVNPKYDDIPEVRCEFPRIYLRAVESAVGDWVIYYEPRRHDGEFGNKGRQAYYAAAQVERVLAHPTKQDSYYMSVSNYLEFSRSVPFRENGFYYESGLKRDDGKTNKGAFGRSVRIISEDEFSLILKTGFVNDAVVSPSENLILQEESESYGRPIVQQLVERPWRDKAFSLVIHSAYCETCAFTGLSLNNGCGLYEVEAAHIKAVKDNGPDSPRNGLALARTMHWLFDEGVLSLEDDGRILMASKLVPSKMRDLLHPDGFARFPELLSMRPHSQFLRFHRENIFRG